MPIIPSTIETNSQTYRDNRAAFEKLIERLRTCQRQVVNGGRDKQIERHLKRGKLMVRDRIDRLLDPHTPFLEFSTLAAWDKYNNEALGAGMVTGVGMVSGVSSVIIANDATVKGGAFYPETIKKHIRAQEIADNLDLPTIYLVDAAGAFLPLQDEVFPDKEHFGHSFYHQCNMSARGLPQIAAVFGGCTAGGAYIPALADEVVMVKGSGQIFLGGPPIVKAAINEIIDAESLGGAELHTYQSGVSDYIAENEPEALAKVRDIMDKINWRQETHLATRPIKPPLYDESEIAGIVSQDPKQPYDIRQIIARLVDGSDLQEFKPDWGTTLVCGTAYLMGHPVGILANNGVLFSESALKGAHFIELCEQRGIPLLFMQNITGFMVGRQAELGGIAKNSAKLVYAVACAKVPRLTLIIGGSYGAGNYGMCGRGFDGDFLFAWPSSRIATMSPDIAVTVLTELRQKSISSSADAQALQKLVDETRAQFEEQSDPFYATARLWDDGLIEPADTRIQLGLCLALVARKKPAPGRWPVFRM